MEKIDESKLRLPATVNQRSLIRQLVRDIPASKDMLEYADFLSHPTIGTASEFISCALEQNLNLVARKENYVDYIANRPRVERVGEHGLFTDAGKPVVLAKVQDEVANHKGPVWTHVISLRREDAVRLGYDSAGQWMALLRSKRAMLCKHMKIDSANLRSAVRSARMGKGADFLRRALIPGGNVSLDSITAAVTGRGELTQVFSHTYLEAAAASGAEAVKGGALTDFERLCDNALTAYLTQGKRVAFGEHPLIGYLYAKENELTTIRIILTGRLAGLDSDTIRERLRESYV